MPRWMTWCERKCIDKCWSGKLLRWWIKYEKIYKEDNVKRTSCLAAEHNYFDYFYYIIRYKREREMSIWFNYVLIIELQSDVSYGKIIFFFFFYSIALSLMRVSFFMYTAKLVSEETIFLLHLLPFNKHMWICNIKMSVKLAVIQASSHRNDDDCVAVTSLTANCHFLFAAICVVWKSQQVRMRERRKK